MSNLYWKPEQPPPSTRDAQHRAVAFGLEDFPDPAGGPLADGDVQSS